MRVQVTRRITHGAVVMHEIDTYEIFGIPLVGGLVSSDFPSVVSLEDIYEHVVEYGEWVKGHLEAMQKDESGNDIWAELDGEQETAVIEIEIFG